MLFGAVHESGRGHETDLPASAINVRCWGWAGKHVLILSPTAFDPKQTSGPIQNNSGLPKDLPAGLR
jgi:hypothetical protein